MYAIIWLTFLHQQVRKPAYLLIHEVLENQERIEEILILVLIVSEVATVSEILLINLDWKKTTTIK